MSYSLNGINHLLITCRSMEETLPFYQDVLGMKVVATAGGSSQDSKTAKLLWDKSAGSIDHIPRTKINRLYFLKFGGTQLAIVEIPEWQPEDQRSVFLPLLWPGAGAPGHPTQVDHLAFGVESREAVVWFQNRLREHGVPVSEIEESNGRLHSIYFYGPNGLPLEIAAFNPDAPPLTTTFRDPDPVPSLKVS
ncbi:MAG: VOC family protein [Paracoccus sp. (in: a-proteobacteria)]|uniref:VOC family protein n=1 Tax=Paracoccus sp. TaxID=267 RepID=UPI0039E3AD78